jgi:dynein heavy chain
VPDKEVREHSEEYIKENNLIADQLEQDPWLQKILQLYDTSCVRHAFMLVGPTGTGKSNITRVLTSALTARSIKHAETKGTDKETWAITRLNPRSINGDQLYGERDESGEFYPGVFSVIWKDVNMRKPKSTISWMVADGPVDAIWVEDLNTVMDDNKILTLANNERIPMSDNVKLVFENESLRNASPATVSRAGIVYVSLTDLGWYRLIRYEKRERETRNLRKGNDYVETYYNKYFKDKNIFQFLFEQRIEGTVPTNEYCKLKAFIDLFNRMLRAFKVDNLDAEHAKMVEQIFVYCLCWGICGTFGIEDRKIISRDYFCLKTNNFPVPKDLNPNETIYDR